MKMFVLKYSVAMVYTLAATVLVLLMAGVFLFQQRTTMVQQNRSLILLNDSILSENIELKNRLLEKQTAGPAKKQSLTLAQ